MFSKTSDFTKSVGFTKSDAFIKTTEFTRSYGFSKSNDFVASSKFTNSQEFSNSNKFSNSNNFSLSQKFSNSNKFSTSSGFTESNDFIPSSKFTNSKEFSNSNLFSKSDHFSQSQPYSESIPFSNSNEFTSSKNFPPTKKFSKTKEFSESHKFSHSIAFSDSHEFSTSEKFSPSFQFTSSQEFLMPNEPSCIVKKNDVNITLDRCSYAGDDVIDFVSIIKTNFTSFINESNGGAILIFDCGFECINVEFTDCVSINGGGGAIYIKNTRFLKYNISIINNNFTRCSAVYGGACYIYSISEQNDVFIQSCLFVSNTIHKSDIINENAEIKGGINIFISAKNMNMSQSIFYNNKGRNGVVRIYNEFDGEMNQKRISQLEEKRNSLSITNCDFDNGNNDKSTSLIYYESNKDEFDVEIKDCKFKGKLGKESHYINGKILVNDTQKIKIKSCQFEYKDKNPLNIQIIDNLNLNDNENYASSHFIASYFRNIDKKVVIIIFCSVLSFVTILMMKTLVFGNRNNNKNLFNEFIEEI